MISASGAVGNGAVNDDEWMVALESINDYLIMQPNDVHALNTAGLIYLHGFQMLEKAEHYFRTGSAKSEGNVIVLLNLFDTAIWMKDLPKADLLKEKIDDALAKARLLFSESKMSEIQGYYDFLVAKVTFSV